MRCEHGYEYDYSPVECDRCYPPECHAHFQTGGHDPYGTGCDLPPGHAGKHRGRDPFGGDGFVEWSGGGSAGGDALPFRDVEWVK